MLNCKFCRKEYSTATGKGLHEVQCKLNPESRNIQKGRSAWNKGLTKETDSRVLKNAKSVQETWTPRGAVLLSSKQLSDKAKAQGFGGYRENAGRSKKFKVVDSFGKVTTLQSSYELRCFQILQELNISWIRPKALKYDERNYFADFYLTEYDIYLDPKNKHKAKIDTDKINKVIQQNNVKLYVLLEEHLTKDFIASLVQW